MMKKVLFLLLVLLALCAACACSAGEAPEDGGSQSNESLAYRLADDGEGYFVKGIGTVSAENIVIPDTYEGKPVIGIDRGAFASKNNIISVQIPQSVKSIDEYAFQACTGLTTLVIPDSVTSIGEGAFYRCTGLVSVSLPNRIEEIPEAAFFECTSLKSVVFPADATSIGLSAFSGCTSLASVTLGANVTSIEDMAFKNCKNLRSVVLPTGLIEIKDEAFSGCQRLSILTIPSTVTTIGDGAFAETGLVRVTIPQSIETVDQNAFSDCYKLIEVYNCSDLAIAAGDSSLCGGVARYAKNVYTPFSGQSILIYREDFVFFREDGTYCLIGYTGADSDIVLPNGVDGEPYFIMSRAFYNDKSLTSITIPAKISGIGNGAFSACTNLGTVHISDLAAWCEMSKGTDGYSGLFAVAKTFCIDGSPVTELSLPEGIEKIASGTFAGCSDIVSVTVPQGVTSIGSYAFYNCTNLKTISLPASLTKVDAETFGSCQNLESIYFDGTTEQWNDMLSRTWNSGLGSYVVYCADGTLER